MARANSDEGYTLVKIHENHPAPNHPDVSMEVEATIQRLLINDGDENSIVCVVAGALAAPCVIAFDYYTCITHHFHCLKWPHSMWLVLAGSALFFFDCAVRTPQWPHVPHRSVQFSGRWCGLSGLLSTGLLYTWWFIHGAQSMADPSSLEVHKMLNCMHLMSVGTALANSFYLSLALRQWRFGKWIFLSQFLLLGLNTPDRMPLSLQQMWPSMFDHSFALFSVIVALRVLLCPHLRVTTASDPPGDSCHPEGFHFHFERLQQMCAALSIMYLMALIMDKTVEIPIWRQVMYHESWALLRPCYFALFAIYWLKRLPLAVFTQALICGTGMGFFVSLCRLVETPGSVSYGTTFDPREREFVSILGRSAHHVEALLFNVSFFLFYLHKTCSGASERSKRTTSAIASAVFVTACCGRYFWKKGQVYFMLIYLIPYLSLIFFAECTLNRVCGLTPCLISVEVVSPTSGAEAMLTTCQA